MGIFKKLTDLKWWLNYRFNPNHKYHLIDTKLSPSYYDIDTIMLHGMFALLDRYVDEEHDGVDSLEEWGKELCLSSDGMSAHYSHVQGEKELEAVALYRWWHEIKPCDEAVRDELTSMLYGTERSGDPSAYKELLELEEKIEREENEMLHRLINIRGGLWT